MTAVDWAVGEKGPWWAGGLVSPGGGRWAGWPASPRSASPFLFLFFFRISKARKRKGLLVLEFYELSFKISNSSIAHLHKLLFLKIFKLCVYLNLNLNFQNRVLLRGVLLTKHINI